MSTEFTTVSQRFRALLAEINELRDMPLNDNFLDAIDDLSMNVEALMNDFESAVARHG